MTQLIKTYMGIQADVQPLSPNDPGVAGIRAQVLTTTTGLNPPQGVTEAYAFKLTLNMSDTYFDISPPEARVSRIDLSIHVNKKQREMELIEFLNGKVPASTFPAGVTGRYDRFDITYALTPNFYKTSSVFQDQLIVGVTPAVRLRHKVLRVGVLAHPTTSLATRWIGARPVQTFLSLLLDPYFDLCRTDH